VKKKPYSAAAEENMPDVLVLIKPLLVGVDEVLELASGTGQQLVYFAENCPEIRWQGSDLAENLPGIECWIEDANLPNINKPIALNVADNLWPFEQIDFAYTSNSLHIMSWEDVVSLFTRLALLLKSGGRFCVYGPFCFSGQHVSESNVHFNAYLKQRNPLSGVRELDDLQALAKEAGLFLESTIGMAHNNHLLVWKKR
jgi:SAM-dependent methyltransferase